MPQNAPVPYLVQASGSIDAADAAEALDDVFVRIATEAIGIAETTEGKPSFDGLRERLNRRKVGISDWRHPGGVVTIGGGEWDRGEIETNLRQIEIIVLALRSAVLRAATSIVLNPTQQSGFDATGLLDGKPWVLEAYGGANVENNNKLKDDASALNTAPGDARKFFACRPTAWRRKGTKKVVASGLFTLVNEPEQEAVMVWEFESSL